MLKKSKSCRSSYCCMLYPFGTGTESDSDLVDLHFGPRGTNYLRLSADTLFFGPTQQSVCNRRLYRMGKTPLRKMPSFSAKGSVDCGTKPKIFLRLNHQPSHHPKQQSHETPMLQLSFQMKTTQHDETLHGFQTKFQPLPWLLTIPLVLGLFGMHKSNIFCQKIRLQKKKKRRHDDGVSNKLISFYELRRKPSLRKKVNNEVQSSRTMPYVHSNT